MTASGEFVNRVLLPTWLLALVLVAVVAGGVLAFLLLPKVPTVTAIRPTNGPATGGTTVTITGSDFTRDSQVRFGSVAARITAVSDRQISAISPAGRDMVDVTVTTAGGTSVPSSATQFTYIPGPGVASISPPSGPVAGGTTVIITGSDFTGASQVLFGSVAARITAVSDRQITVISPAGSGTVHVTVITPGGTSAITNAAKFTYIPGPTLQDIYNRTPAFQDRLADNTNGWCVYANCNYAGGVLHLINSGATGPSYVIGTPYQANLDLRDFAYTVEMKVLKGFGGGIIFRGTNGSRAGLAFYYYFLVGTDGSYQIYLRGTGTPPSQILQRGTSAAIRTGSGQSNILTVVALGSTMILYINQQFVTSFSNGTYDHGTIGVLAYDSGHPYNEANPPVEVVFSNARVWML